MAVVDKSRLLGKRLLSALKTRGLIVADVSTEVDILNSQVIIFNVERLRRNFSALEELVQCMCENVFTLFLVITKGFFSRIVMLCCDVSCKLVICRRRMKVHQFVIVLRSSMKLQL